MRTEYAIRDAREEELDALLALYRSYYRELAGYGMNYELDEAQLPDVLRAKIKSRLLLAAVAEGEDGRLAGFSFCAISRLGREHRCRGKSSVGFLQELYVVPEARRLGLAGRLADYAKSWLRDNGITTLSLEVLCGNPAGLAFWKRQGLVPVATVCQQNLDEGDHEMKKNVKDTLRDYIIQYASIEPDDPDFSDDVDLFDYGFVDSLGATEIVLFLEETFGVEITQADITLYPMNTIDEIAGVVERKLEEK